MRISNALLGIINVITSLLSLAIIGGGIWLAVKHHTECARLAQWPVIGVGAFLLIVSLLGLIGAFGKVRCLLGVYLIVVFLLVLLVLAFTIFAFVVTNKGAGHQVSGKGFKEYHLGDYSTWLQRHVVNKSSTWKKIKSCLIDADVCKSLETDFSSAKLSNGSATGVLASFYQKELSPIQSGCCKPPTACNFTYEGGSTWTSPTNATADSDCSQWGNDTSTLCFNCDSCRAGVLQKMKSSWKKVVFVNVGVLVLLILILTLGCCACANSRSRKGFAGFYVKT